MKKSLHLSIEPELYRYLKHKRVNVSKYVEKLVVKDIATQQLSGTTGKVANGDCSNPCVPTFF